MKKIALFMLIGLCLLALPVRAQINLLHEFGPVNIQGAHPRGDLISDGTYFYGMVSESGQYNRGTIFRIVLVSSAADSGPGTLRQALADAQERDIITFPEDFAGRTIALASPLYVQQNGVTLTGLTTADGLCCTSGDGGVTQLDLIVSNNNDLVNGDTSTPNALIANPGPDGISLREALLAANNAVGPHTISFNQALAGQTIALTTCFAPITRDGINLTGLTSNGQPNITIDATGASNPGPIFFVAASAFSMSGLNFPAIPNGFDGIQIGGNSGNVSAPSLISNFQISGNSFNNGSGSNFAIWVCHTPNHTNGATISNVVIANNSFANLFESVNVQGGGSNNVIQDVTIYGNSFSQNTSFGTSAVEVADSTGTNTVIQRVQVLQNSFTGNLQGVVLNINGTTSNSSIQNTQIARNIFVGNLQALGVVSGVEADTTNNVIANTQIVDNVVSLTGYNGQGSATIQIIDNQNGSNNQVNGVSLVNNTINNSDTGVPPGAGVWVTSSGGVTGVSVVNSIFWGFMNDTFKGVTSGQVSYSIVNQSGFTGTNHNFNSDPMFVDPQLGDYHLRPGSPAIDAGFDSGAPMTDLEGKPRPMDGDDDGIAVCDIGAFEAGTQFHTLNLTSTSGGTTNPNPGVYYYAIGTQVQISPIPDTYSTFFNWSGSATGNTEPLTITMDSDKSITANFAISDSITVTSPNGGESWIVGESHDITWSSTGSITNVNIDYSTDNGSTWISVVAGTANDGSYTWTVPHMPSLTCLVRVSDAANAKTMDASNTVFNILDNGTPAITVTSPNGGESWQAGTTKDITWNSSGPISAVKIELSFNGGSLWSTIIASTPNDGSYSWDIVKVPSLNCFMRISDVLGTSSDTSDAPFVLQSPPSLTDNYFILPVKWTDTPFGSGGWYVGDFNGDGRSDLMRYLLDGTRNEVLLSSGNDFAAESNWITADHGADGWHVGDYNGDGRSDLMRYVPGVSGAQVFLSNGSNFIYSGSWTGAGNGADGWYVGDYNGDGRSDLMRYVPGVSGGEVFLSNGSSFVYNGSWTGAGNGSDGWYVGDFNGDGRSDIMRYVPGVSGGQVFLSDGTKFVYDGSWTGAGNGDNGWYLGKFSGTARTDIMRYVLLLSGADVFLNTGTGFTYDGSWTPAGRGDNDWHVGDFNGDGRDDLMRSIVGVTGADVLISNASGGATLSGKPLATQTKGDKGRWLGDVPFAEGIWDGVAEKAFVAAIKNRIAAGEEVSIYQIQKEYEKLKGKTCSRVRIMKLLKHHQWDSMYRIKADDLLK